MTDLLLFVLLCLVFDNINLLRLAVLQYVSNNGSTLNIRSTNRKSFAVYTENLIKSNLLAFSKTKLLYEDNVTLSNLVLLFASAYDSDFTRK